MSFKICFRRLVLLGMIYFETILKTVTGAHKFAIQHKISFVQGFLRLLLELTVNFFFIFTLSKNHDGR